MATINAYTAKDGTKSFRVRVRMKGQQTQTATFPSLTDARKFATLIEGQMLAGKHFPTSKPQHTLSELLDRYVQDVMPRKSEETQKSHMAVIRFWREPLGHKLLTDITKADIVACRNALKDKAPATIRKYLVILSHAFNIGAKEYEWLDTNIVNHVVRPSPPPGRVRYLSDDERSRLFQECRKSKNPHLYSIR